jgi:copper chaperone
MTKEFTVPSMSCQHCVNAITKEVSNIEGVRNVNVNLNTKQVSVEADERIPTDTLVNAIKEAGYDDVTVSR